MLRSAYGHALNIKQSDIGIRGWAVECRVYAEVNDSFLCRVLPILVIFGFNFRKTKKSLHITCSILANYFCKEIIGSEEYPIACSKIVNKSRTWLQRIELGCSLFVDFSKPLSNLQNRLSLSGHCSLKRLLYSFYTLPKCEMLS